MKHRSIPALLTSLLIAACGADGDPGEVAVIEEPAMPTMNEAMDMESFPDTTVAAVWAHLEEENYAEDWELWPGKAPMYEGVEPHGMLLNTYLNSVAMEGLTGSAGALPDHSIVVKENYMPDRTLAAITVMYKVPGYDSSNNDWWWAKRNSDGSIDGQGRVPMCVSCHSAASGNDYLLTGTLESNGMEITQAAEAMKGGM